MTEHDVTRRLPTDEKRNLGPACLTTAQSLFNAQGQASFITALQERDSVSEAPL
jgi:hypothetical protein